MKKITSTFSRLASAVVVALCIAQLPIPGARAESLEEAIEAWLADKDEVALPTLAALAGKGDVKAQLLLGKIATRPFSPYVKALPRKQRMSLLRAPGGLSGTSWLKVAAGEGDALAAAVLGAIAPPYSTTDIAALLDKGEDDAVAATLRRALMHGEINGPKDVFARRNLPADVAYAAHIAEVYWGDAAPVTSWQPGEDPLRIIEILAVGAAFSRRPPESPARDMSFRLFPGDERGTRPEPAGELLIKLASVSRPAHRVVSYCHAACPGMIIRTCIGDALTLAGGYDALWQLGPPVQSLIGEERYLESPRFHADFARQLTTLMAAWPQKIQDDWSERSCAAASRLRINFTGTATIDPT